MTIPDRLKLRPVNSRVMTRMMELCDLIERELESGGDATTLLNEWHSHTGRRCDPYEFQTYWKSVSKDTFVLEALNPAPSFDQDVRHAEVVAVLEAVVEATVPESEIEYYIGWLEAQFPGSNVSDLIYWPDEWFGNASLFRDDGGAFKQDASLSSDQTIAYAMAKSGRHLDEAPHIDLPFPMPSDD